MKITKETLRQLIMEELQATLTENPETSRPGQKGRDNPVLYKVNQIDYYVKLLRQAALNGKMKELASPIQAIKDLLAEIEGKRMPVWEQV